nr:MAG TPA: hypothetical protein [Caudoviricetes sp.]
MKPQYLCCIQGSFFLFPLDYTCLIFNYICLFLLAFFFIFFIIFIYYFNFNGLIAPI